MTAGTGRVPVVDVRGTSTRLADVRVRNLIFGLIGSAIVIPSTVNEYRCTVASSGSVVTLQRPPASFVSASPPPVGDANVGATIARGASWSACFCGNAGWNSAA